MCALVWAALSLGAPDPAALALDQRISAAGNPFTGTVVIGNSKATTDLDIDLLRQLRPRDYVVMNVFGSQAPVWYAVLKNRVYGNGHRPEEVIVYSTLSAMLAADLPNEYARAVLSQQMGSLEPVLIDGIFRGVYDDAVRTRLPKLLQPPCSEGRLRDSDPGDGRPERFDAAPPAMPTAGIMPHLIALAQSYGSVVRAVRVPQGPSRQWQDDVAPARRNAWLDVAESLGVPWIDLSKTMPEAAFGDGVHMSQAGRALFTPLLAQALEQPPLVKIAAAVVTGVRRDGALPRPLMLELPGEGCERLIVNEAWQGVSDLDLVQRGYGAVSPLEAWQGALRLRPQVAPDAPCAGAQRPGRLSGYDTGAAWSLRARAEFPIQSAEGHRAHWVAPGTTVTVSTAPLWGQVEVRVWVASGKGEVAIGGEVHPLGVGETAVRQRGAGARSVTVRSEGWALIVALVHDKQTVLGMDGPRIAVHRLNPTWEPTYPEFSTPLVRNPDGLRWTGALPGVPSDEAGFLASGQGGASPLALKVNGVGAANLIVNNAGLLVASVNCALLAEPEASVARLLATARNRWDAAWILPDGHRSWVVQTSGLGGQRFLLRLGVAAMPNGPAGRDVVGEGKLRLVARWGNKRWEGVWPLALLDAQIPYLELVGATGPLNIDIRHEGGNNHILLTSLYLEPDEP